MDIASADELYSLLKRLFPINRSITGDGVRETLEILAEKVDLKILTYPSGKQVYDWTIPDEWNISDAYIANESGERLVDFKRNGLHVVGYSMPVNRDMTFEELKPHLHTLPDLPDAIPYRTSYYAEQWGFCLKHHDLELFDCESKYHVVVQSERQPGELIMGEALLPGESSEELLISTYCCHPWMANDNLSGVVTAVFLYRYLASLPKRRFSYRFVWLPETIGAITYLAHHEAEMKSLFGGFVLSCCGGQGPIAYKETFLGSHVMDRAVRLAFRDSGIKPWERPFAPDGSDERQYSMPAFRIPVCTIAKDKYYDYDYYHTSLDDLDFVSGENLKVSFDLYIKSIDILEQNLIYKNTIPFCEAQLGVRGLYPQTGGSVNQRVSGEQTTIQERLDAITWLMFLADGQTDLISIAERSKQPFDNLVAAIDRLSTCELLELV